MGNKISQTNSTLIEIQIEDDYIYILINSKHK